MTSQLITIDYIDYSLMSLMSLIYNVWFIVRNISLAADLAPSPARARSKIPRVRLAPCSSS